MNNLEKFFEEVYRLSEETGEKYANAIKVVFPSGTEHNYSDTQMHNFNDKRFEQEKHKTIVRGLPYFEGATEEEFRKEFNDFLNDFFDKGDIDKKDKTIIKEFFMDYIQRLALNDVKEVRNEKNIGAGLGRLNPCPLRHHQK